MRAVAFYEQRSPGLGADLIAEFERSMKLCAERPHAWKQVHPAGIRRMGLKRFPFAIFFRPAADGILLITAFAHHRQQPGYWMGRLI